MKKFNYSALHSRGERVRSYETPKMPNYGVPSWRQDSTRNIPSRVPTVDTTAKSNRHEYTGTYIKGIATMHKSNTIPVTSDSQAIDIAKMRRN